MFDFLRFAAIIGAFVFGLRANAIVRYRSNYGDFMAVPLRVLVGLAAWTMLIAIFISKWSTAFGAAVVTAIPLAITAWNIHQEGSNPVKPMLYLLFASMGIYSRMVMYFTIIGIGVVRRVDRGAQIGQWEEMLERHHAMSGQEQRRGSGFFTVLDMPETITGPYGHTYTRVNTSSDSAEYISTHDSSMVTIHDNELGVQNAKTGDGQYFHW